MGLCMNTCVCALHISTALDENPRLYLHVRVQGASVAACTTCMFAVILPPPQIPPLLCLQGLQDASRPLAGSQRPSSSAGHSPACGAGVSGTGWQRRIPWGPWPQREAWAEG